MNKVILSGRLTKDPDVRKVGEKTVAKYTLAVDRRYGNETDFIPCTVWDKGATFAEKWLRKGMMIAISGRIQTGSYKGKDGNMVYTTDVVVEDQEFAESKGEQTKGSQPKATSKDLGFMQIPDGVPEELPFD